MNRKEIAEIRKLLCMQRNPIHTIYGCYVNSEKDLLSEFKHPALSLPEDELFKYLDIFRKALSRKKEKNLTGGFSSVGRICRWNTTLFISILQWNG